MSGNLGSLPESLELSGLPGRRGYLCALASPPMTQSLSSLGSGVWARAGKLSLSRSSLEDVRGAICMTVRGDAM